MSNNACKSQSGNSETTSFVHNDSDSSNNNNDDDDDDDDGSKNENKDLNNDSIPFGATATVAESTAATATSTSTSAATASGTKRPMTSASSGEELGLASSRNRKRSDHGAPRKQKLKPLRPDGCMLNPRHPIKIFATDRDKTTRRKLRRFLNQQRNNNHNRNDNNNDNDNTEAMYRNHWSVDHCWTFREMLGFDRFSGLRTQSRTDLLGTGTETETGAGAGAGTIIDLDATTVGSEITRTQPRPPGSGRSVGIGIGIDWIFVTTYVLDVDYLLNELPELLEIPTVVVVYQYKDLDGGANEEAWIREVSRKKGHNLFFLERNPRNSPRSQSNPLGVRMAYGCHHTKMTLVGYSSGRLRVHVHTSNLRREDVHDKCQGAFLQDFLPKNDDQLSNFVTSDFEESLVTYLESYHFVLPMVWWKRNPSSDTNTLCGEHEHEHEHEHDYFEATATTLVAHLQTYDFSTAVGVLIPSVPGYHRASLGGRSDEVYGYLKVQRAIQEHCNNNNNNNKNSSRSSSNNKYNKPLAGPGAIVCQFSSMGAVWEPYLDKIAAAWNADATKGTSATVTTKPKPKKGKLAASRLRLVWPTTREITESVEGPAGGASVPGTAKNLHKPFLRPLLHKWRSGASDRTGEKKQANKTNKEITTESSFRCYREYDPLDKGHHVPHIKTYYQMCEREPDPDRDDKNNNMLWFVLSSHNLSVAAWGQIQNRSTHFGREVLTVQHWELGVFVAPSTLGVDAMGPVCTAHHHHHQRGSSTAEHAKPTRAIIPLPYQFRPDRYEDSDQPWVVR